MKNALIIAPYFPPSSMPPVHRVRLLVNYLEEFGWHPIVLTVSPEYHEGIMDWELVNLLPKDLEIYSTQAFSVKWTRLFGVGNVSIRSLIYLFFAARDICKKRQIDVLFMQPNPIIWIIGRFIKHRFNIPYVVDYQDPWVSEYGRYASPIKKAWWANRLARLLEPMVLKKVSHITGVSQGTYEKVRVGYPYLKDRNFTEIPFGGEPGDFEYLESSSTPNPIIKKDNTINFVYVGVIGHGIIKILRAFMLAVRKVKEFRPELYEKMRLFFYGSAYAYPVRPEDMMATITANEIGIEDIVIEHPGRLGYLDALRVMQRSDVILVLSAHSPHYTASKIYPCILARRPILALFHEQSLVVKVIHEMKAGRVVTFSDTHPVERCIDQLAEEIEHYVQKRSFDMPPVDQAIFEKYSARNMTQKLAMTFDRTTGLLS